MSEVSSARAAMDHSPEEPAVADMHTRSPIFARRVLGGMAAGTLLAVAFPPYNAVALLPLGFGLLLLQLRGVTVRQAAYIGLACGLVYFGGTLFWLANLFGAAAISLIAIAAAFPMLFALLYVALRRRFPRFPTSLMAPLVWTAVEYYRSEPFVLNFGWMGFGYAVVNAPVFAILASAFGSYGLTFLLAALGAGLSEAAIAPPRRWTVALLAAGWLAVLYLPPRSIPAPTHPLSVRLVQAQGEDDESFVELSQPILGRPVDVIVWPEYSMLSDPTKQPRVWRRLQRVAQANHAHFLFGAEDQFDPADRSVYHNTAFVLDPTGREIGRHAKNHTVHFFRDGVAGTAATAVPSALGRLGVAICFDMDYPDVARRLAADGAEVFLVPNMDPMEWGPVQQVQHRLTFQMRAAECGRWLARADVAGGTSVAAPDGQEAARVMTSKATRLEAAVGRETTRTLFVRGGWRFGQACFWTLCALCIGGLIARKRPA